MATRAGQWWSADQPVFSTTEIWKLVAALCENGYDARELLAGSPAHFERLLDPNARLSFNEFSAFAAAAMKTGIRCLPLLLGRRLHLSSFGVPGFAVLSSSTVEQAIETAVRFAPLLNVKFPLVRMAPNRLRLESLRDADGDTAIEAQVFLIDLAKLVTFLRDMLGPKFIPRALKLCGDETRIEDLEAEISRLRSADPRCKIAAEIEIPAELLTRRLPQAHNESHCRSVEYCLALLYELRASTDIKSVIISRLQNLDVNVPSLADIAAELKMSERTLRRRLSRLSTSYSQLRDEVRNSLATELLISPDLTTEDVAERLGYSDAANFRHAFKRWHGEAPSCFRKKLNSLVDMRAVA